MNPGLISDDWNRDYGVQVELKQDDYDKKHNVLSSKVIIAQPLSKYQHAHF